MNDRLNYVLVTAAMNEKGYIERTIEAVLAQLPRPAAWAIVDDGSTDETGAIIDRYARDHAFIKPIHIVKKEGRNFASKVHALRAGIDLVMRTTPDYLGILDADITLPPDFYARVLSLFRTNARLGISSGYIFEERGGRFRSRPVNTHFNVAGAIQVFRRACYEEIGGFIPIEMGDEDWFLEIKARSLGWEVKAEPSIRAYHHRPTGTTNQGAARMQYNNGIKDYRMGSLPLFEFFKCLRRARERPYVLGTFIRFYGYIHAAFSRTPRIDAPDVIAFLRGDQRKRLNIFKNRKRSPKQPSSRQNPP
jgi:glycosyltransferase involved in cell wall biosynthesis